MYVCYQNLYGIYKPPVLSKLFIHRPASTLTTLLSKTSPTPQDLSAPPPAALDDPYERILLLEVLERHQELLYYLYWMFPCPVDRCCSCTALLVSTRRTAALPWRAIQVHTQGRAIQVHTQNVLSKCTLRTCYPSAHSECVIQVHTQNVLSKCTLRTCYPSAWYTRAPLTYSHAPLTYS